MEERKPILKILYENTEKPVNQIWLTFPLSGRERAEQKMLALTKGHEKESSISFRIARVESPYALTLLQINEISDRQSGIPICTNFVANK